MNGILITLLFISAVTAVLIILVKTEIISLKNTAQVKVFYSALTISLLAFCILLSVKLLTSDEGKKWLDSFSENGDCERIDRPYWCEL